MRGNRLQRERIIGDEARCGPGLFIDDKPPCLFRTHITQASFGTTTEFLHSTGLIGDILRHTTPTAVCSRSRLFAVSGGPFWDGGYSVD
jgi:hypothetical protein